MLQITIPPFEAWDEHKEEFVEFSGQTLQLEHSLLSISKWESKWCRSFIYKGPVTEEETIDYIKHMTISRNVKPEVYDYLTPENINEIKEYINAPMTATTFAKENGGKKSNEIITNELIYYWMIALTIPMECEKWHLNRLLTLIRVCNAKNQPAKKMSKRDIMSRNAALNAARRKQYNTTG